MRVSIVATALDGQQPESKSVINMVHRINNRNPGYSDFSNIHASPQSLNISNIATEGATALKLDTEVEENILENQNSLISEANDSINEQIAIQENGTSISKDLMENNEAIEKTHTSNGLEDFAIEEETPNLFNEENDNVEKEFTSFDKDEGSDSDDLEIPAFLRRQKN